MLARLRYIPRICRWHPRLILRGSWSRKALLSRASTSWSRCLRSAMAMQDRVARLRKAALSPHLQLSWRGYSIPRRAPYQALRRQRTGPPRCGHGSSLSPAIHALVAARLGDAALAERHFRQASEIDLSDNMGNAAGGVHVGALGGLWQAAVFGFAGLCFTDEGPEHRPNLPPSWRSLSMRFQWQGRWHEVVLPENGAGRRTTGDEP